MTVSWQHVMPTDVDMWWKDLKVYLKERKNVTNWEESMNDGTFPKYLSDFLYHEDGAQAKRKFLFAGGAEVECDEPAPEIAASRFFPFLIFFVVAARNSSRCFFPGRRSD